MEIIATLRAVLIVKRTSASQRMEHAWLIHVKSHGLDLAVNKNAREIAWIKNARETAGYVQRVVLQDTLVIHVTLGVLKEHSVPTVTQIVV